MSRESALKKSLRANKKRLARARARIRNLDRIAKQAKAKVALRRKQLADLQPSGAKAALKWAFAQVGTRESPPGSNRGPKISVWERFFGFGAVPWCGVFLGYALKQGGAKGIGSRVASVALIEDDARSGRNGFKALVSVANAQPGDAVILFGRGVHVGLVERVDRARRIVHTVEGNTSSGSAGSQSNGGMVARRARSFSVVRAVARPRY